jgi:hypothetical protein
LGGVGPAPLDEHGDDQVQRREREEHHASTRTRAMARFRSSGGSPVVPVPAATVASVGEMGSLWSVFIARTPAGGLFKPRAARKWPVIASPRVPRRRRVPARRHAVVV